MHLAQVSPRSHVRNYVAHRHRDADPAAGMALGSLLAAV